MFNDLKIKKEALPSNVPVFPLTGAILLPGTEIPLNIFEPKYINMVDDALAEKKLIALVQPKQGIFTKMRKNKPLYNVGCVGKIKAFNETDDGRYLIVLNGVCRFSLDEEIVTMRGYRRFKVNYEDYVDDFNISEERKAYKSEISRRDLFERIDSYIFQATDEHKNLSSYQAFDKMEDSYLIDFISSYMPFSPQEKQSLLECKTLHERTKRLYKILGFKEISSELNNNITIH